MLLPNGDNHYLSLLCATVALSAFAKFLQGISSDICRKFWIYPLRNTLGVYGMRVPRQNGSIIARRGRGIFLCLFQKKWWLGRTWSISHASNCSRATIKLETKSTALNAVDDSNFFIMLPRVIPP